MRKALKITAAVLLMAALLMIVAPRMLVKNKHATMVYGGRKFEDVRVFHGPRDPFGPDLLIDIEQPGEEGYYLVAYNNLLFCPRTSVLSLKLVAYWKRGTSCKNLVSDGIFIRNNQVTFRSVRGVPVEVYWQPPPR